MAENNKTPQKNNAGMDIYSILSDCDSNFDLDEQKKVLENEQRRRERKKKLIDERGWVLWLAGITFALYMVSIIFANFFLPLFF